MIRRATLDDLDKVLELTYAFNAEYFDVPLDGAKTTAMLIDVLQWGVVFLSEDGYIGGKITHDLFRDWSVLHEFAWYSRDGAGAALLDAFIAHAEQTDVNEVRVCTLANSPDVAARLISSRGLDPLETSYRRILCQQSQH